MLININYWFPCSGLFFQRENNLECSQEMLNDCFGEEKSFENKTVALYHFSYFFNQSITSQTIVLFVVSTIDEANNCIR